MGERERLFPVHFENSRCKRTDELESFQMHVLTDFVEGLLDTVACLWYDENDYKIKILSGALRVFYFFFLDAHIKNLFTFKYYRIYLFTFLVGFLKIPSQRNIPSKERIQLNVRKVVARIMLFARMSHWRTVIINNSARIN